MSDDFAESSKPYTANQIQNLARILVSNITKGSFEKPKRQNQSILNTEREYPWESALLLYGEKENTPQVWIVFPDKETKNQLIKHPLISGGTISSLESYHIATITPENANKLQTFIAEKDKNIAVFENVDLGNQEELLIGIKNAFKSIKELQAEHIKAGKQKIDGKLPTHAEIMKSFVLSAEDLGVIYSRAKMPQISVSEVETLRRPKQQPQKPASEALWDETLIEQLKSAGATIEVNPNGQAKLRAKNQDGGRLTIELDTDTHKIIIWLWS